jgi:hypothetical protein
MTTIEATINKVYKLEVNLTALAPNGVVADWIDSGHSYTKSIDAVRPTDPLASQGMYVCTDDHISSSATEPGIGVDWETVWYLAVKDGPAGETGCANVIPVGAFAVGHTGGKDIQSAGPQRLINSEFTGGLKYPSYDAGTKASGTFTLDPVNGNLQRAVNNGAHTLAIPAVDTLLVLKYTNGASAGAVTITGANKVIGSMNTTNGNSFLLQIISIAGTVIVNITGAQ